MTHPSPFLSLRDAELASVRVALDALVSSVAVIDDQGVIRAANRGWRETIRGGVFGNDGLETGADFFGLLWRCRGRRALGPRRLPTLSETS